MAGPKTQVTKLILRNHLSPGDIVMLTAAVRDLHRCYPKRFATDVRTPCPHLWENNPYITTLDEHDPKVRVLQCEYPLMHRSNQAPVHFIYGFIEFLNETLRLRIRPSECKGDIHISDLEKSWFSQVREILGQDVLFWILVAGGKRDFTHQVVGPAAVPDGGEPHFRAKIVLKLQRPSLRAQRISLAARSVRLRADANGEKVEQTGRRGVEIEYEAQATR